MSPISNTKRALSSRRAYPSARRKSTFFQVVVAQREDLRYIEPDGNPMVGLALGKSRRLGGLLPADRRRSADRQIDQHPAHGLGPAAAALRLAALRRGQCPD